MAVGGLGSGEDGPRGRKFVAVVMGGGLPESEGQEKKERVLRALRNEDGSLNPLGLVVKVLGERGVDQESVWEGEERRLEAEVEIRMREVDEVFQHDVRVAKSGDPWDGHWSGAMGVMEWMVKKSVLLAVDGRDVGWKGDGVSYYSRKAACDVATDLATRILLQPARGSMGNVGSKMGNEGRELLLRSAALAMVLREDVHAKKEGLPESRAAGLVHLISPVGRGDEVADAIRSLDDQGVTGESAARMAEVLLTVGVADRLMKGWIREAIDESGIVPAFVSEETAGKWVRERNFRMINLLQNDVSVLNEGGAVNSLRALREMGVLQELGVGRGGRAEGDGGASGTSALERAREGLLLVKEKLDVKYARLNKEAAELEARAAELRRKAQEISSFMMGQDGQLGPEIAALASRIRAYETARPLIELRERVYAGVAEADQVRLLTALKLEKDGFRDLGEYRALVGKTPDGKLAGVDRLRAVYGEQVDERRLSGLMTGLDTMVGLASGDSTEAWAASLKQLVEGIRALIFGSDSDQADQGKALALGRDGLQSLIKGIEGVDVEADLVRAEQVRVAAWALLDKPTST